MASWLQGVNRDGDGARVSGWDDDVKIMLDKKPHMLARSTSTLLTGRGYTC